MIESVLLLNLRARSPNSCPELIVPVCLLETRVLQARAAPAVNNQLLSDWFPTFDPRRSSVTQDYIKVGDSNPTFNESHKQRGGYTLLHMLPFSTLAFLGGKDE